jgi:hypothetical protein
MRSKMQYQGLNLEEFVFYWKEYKTRIRSGQGEKWGKGDWEWGRGRKKHRAWSRGQREKT